MKGYKQYRNYIFVIFFGGIFSFNNRSYLTLRIPRQYRNSQWIKSSTHSICSWSLSVHVPFSSLLPPRSCLRHPPNTPQSSRLLSSPNSETQQRPSSVSIPAHTSPPGLAGWCGFCCLERAPSARVVRSVAFKSDPQRSPGRHFSNAEHHYSGLHYSICLQLVLWFKVVTRQVKWLQDVREGRRASRYRTARL